MLSKLTVLTVPYTIISFIITGTSVVAFLITWTMVRAINVVSRAFSHAVHIAIAFIVTILTKVYIFPYFRVYTIDSIDYII